MDWLKDKVVLITGGTGSLGQTLTKKILADSSATIRVISRNEYLQYEMRRSINNPRVRYLIGDIRDTKRLYRAMFGANYVIHTAALKHVDLCQYNPLEAVGINIDGSASVVSAAIDSGVEKVIGISSDKAVHPENIYGSSKQCMEWILIHSNVYGDTKFSCVRCGNFQGSRGSFIPQLYSQVEKGEPITITDREMTRFWITLDEAASFVLKSLEIMEGGEIFIPKMPEKTVMEVVNELAPNVEVKIIGRRPGEKLRERLWSEDEESIVKDKGDYYLIKYERWM